MIVSLAIIFFVFGILQLNDPDPLLWTSIYWGHALLLGLSLKKLIPPRMMLGLGLCALLGSVVLWPSEFYGLAGNMEQQVEIEEARESLGLFLISCSQLGVAWLQSKAS